MADNKDSAKSTRQKAAEARAAAQAAERRRENMIRIVGGIAVLVVVLGIVAIGILNRGGNDSANPSDSPDANSALPTGITADNGYGYQVSNPAGKPAVVVYEDFQCPACQQFEAKYGATMQQWAQAGDFALTYRIMTFLDKNLQTDHSVRAANAFGCAITAGQGTAYHNAVYTNQPANEGDGWTDEQLKQFGTDAGITGEAKTTFDKCVDDGQYKGWAQLSNQAAFDDGVTGTPTLEVNGQKVDDAALANEQALREALTNPQQ